MVKMSGKIVILLKCWNNRFSYTQLKTHQPFKKVPEKFEGVLGQPLKTGALDETKHKGTGRRQRISPLVRVNVHVCVCVCKHTCVILCMNAHVWVYMCRCAHVHVYALRGWMRYVMCIFMCVNVHVCTCVYMQCVHVFMYVNMHYAHMYLCESRVYICICVCTGTTLATKLF